MNKDFEIRLKKLREEDAFAKKQRQQIELVQEKIRRHLDTLQIKITKSDIPEKLAQGMAYTHLTMQLYNRYEVYQNLSRIEDRMHDANVRYEVIKK